MWWGLPLCSTQPHIYNTMLPLSVVDPAHPTLSHHTCAWSHHTLSHHTHTAVGADRVASVPPVGTSTRLRAASAPDRLSAMCGACHSMCTGLMSLHCCMRAPWCARHHGEGAGMRLCGCFATGPQRCSPDAFERLDGAVDDGLHGDLARIWPCRLAQQLLAERDRCAHGPAAYGRRRWRESVDAIAMRA